MLAIKIIPFCKYNKNWYRAWGKWHKIILNKGKILIFLIFFIIIIIIIIKFMKCLSWK